MKSELRSNKDFLAGLLLLTLVMSAFAIGVFAFLLKLPFQLFAGF